MRPYYELNDFDEVYLEDSFVLCAVASPRSVRLLVELVLRESHAAYAPPLVGEMYCYRRGEIVFEAVTDLAWKMYDRRPAIDASGTHDYGGIDLFEFEGNRYVIEGDFGRLSMEADICRLEVPEDGSNRRIDVCE